MDGLVVTVALEDRSAGYEAEPSRIRLSTLAAFTEEVAQFLGGSTREVDPSRTDVEIVQGSFALRTGPLPASLQLFRDLAALGRQSVLRGIDPKRGSIVQRWQSRAQACTDVSIKIEAPVLSRPIVVSARTDFHADDADQWVDVERYVKGEILNLGGATNPNARVRLPDGKLLTVATDKAVLRDESTNRLYKVAMLRIKGRYNVVTHELKDARLVSFIEYAPRFDQDELDTLAEKGRAAWADVSDPDRWLEELRGGEQG